MSQETVPASYHLYEVTKLEAEIERLTDELQEHQSRAIPELHDLRAALGEIAGNKTNSRAWLEDRARRALEPKP